MRVRRFASHFEVTVRVPDPWSWAVSQWKAFWGRRAFRRMARAALADGTRVRLACGCSRSRHSHGGVWTTSWTPRRIGGTRPWEEPDDYLLTREGDGETTYATRGVLEIVAEGPRV